MIRRGIARAALAAACALVAAPAAAQVTVSPPSTSRPGGDTLTSVTPTFVIQGVNLPAARPLRFRLEIASNRDFVGTPLLDTVVTTVDSAAAIAPASALDGGVRIWWRARVIDPAGTVRSSTVGGPLTVPNWVTPISPPTVVGQPVRTRRPQFIWRSPPVNEPPGPWEYRIEITNLGQQVWSAPVRDTFYVVPAQARLEANATYRWTITASLPRTGQATVVPSPVAFFVEDPTVITSTILYQNFPNPFPAPLANWGTCVWFDLGSPARVQLDVYDLRGLHVRRLLPNGKYTGELPVGRYGRAASETNEGCDRDFAWDGRASDGRIVPAGVYLLRFRADGVESTKKILFRGQ